MQPLQSFATEHVDDVQVWSPCLKLEGNITTLNVSKFFSIWETKIVSFFFISIKTISSSLFGHIFLSLINEFWKHWSLVRKGRQEFVLWCMWSKYSLERVKADWFFLLLLLFIGGFFLRLSFICLVVCFFLLRFRKQLVMTQLC